ncbi:MAG: hypothetical protein SGJ27_18730 [Candidatus Melainabacteria bacterium]|nr:hypothetical protein [Candidatus Melainabacteria bacterium]
MTDKEEERIRKAVQRISGNIGDLNEARQLVESGEFEKALSLYMQSLKGSVGGLSDLNLKACLEKLVQEYPPAREAFEKKRDQHESEMLKGRQSRWLIEEWTEINKALGEDYRELEFLQRLQQKPNGLDDFNAYQTIRTNLPKYLQDQRYDVLEPYLNRLGSMFLSHYSNYEIEVYFPQITSEDPTSFLLEEVLQEGPMIYEVCLGLQKISLAERIAQKIFAVSKTNETYRSMLTAARRAGHDEQIKILLNDAKKSLSKVEFEGIRKDFKI